VPDLSDGYHATRRRIAGLVTGRDLSVRVPACPEWTAHDVVAHVAGMASALTSGHFPGAAQQAWIDGLVDQRRSTPIAEVLAEWESCADATSAFVDGGAGMLFVDLVVHEHDLRAALGEPGGRGTPEVRAVIQPLLETLHVKDAGLGALLVDSDGVTWTSHLGKPGVTFHVDPWEAMRILASRRTVDELHATPHTGDVDAYVKVIDAHLPLPATSLHES
jgi:uncharacterized protein (TIGR03083 family)